MKRNIIVLIALFVISCLPQRMQAENSYSVSTSVGGARYEIIQSPVARRFFFKLDKELGIVWQLTKSTEDNLDEFSWDLVSTSSVDRMSDKDGQINYQLFCGGFAVSDIILLNVNTGKSYIIFKDIDTNESFFERIK